MKRKSLLATLMTVAGFQLYQVQAQTTFAGININNGQDIVFKGFSNGVNVPDYVFEPDYNLKSLEEIELYVKELKHLPEMNLLLLKKVEEMTLQLIQINHEMKKQAGLINEQSNKIKFLENR